MQTIELILQTQEFPFQEFSALVIAHMIAVASPGPDFAVVTKNTVEYGKKIGQITALGVGFAILLHVTYALLGVSVLVQTKPIIYKIISWLGAAFLVYLGVQELQSKPKAINVEQSNHLATPLSNKKAFGMGFLTNALNVKAMLFFLFLFTSIVKSSTSVNTKLIYGLWLSSYTFLWFYLIATIIGLPVVRNFFLNYGVWFNRLMGVILIGFAILLVYTQI